MGSAGETQGCGPRRRRPLLLCPLLPHPRQQLMLRDREVVAGRMRPVGREGALVNSMASVPKCHPGARMPVGFPGSVREHQFHWIGPSGPRSV